MFLDIALSVVAGNRLDIYRRRGEPIPAGWALDKDGEPTTDAIAANDGRHLRAAGRLQRLGHGDHDVADDVVSGRRRVRRPRATATGTTNHWFAAYDVRQFVDPARFVSRSPRRARARPTQPAPRSGFERVYAPGDLENKNARTYLKEGIPLEQFTLDELAWVAEHTGVQLPFRSRWHACNMS